MTDAPPGYRMLGSADVDALISVPLALRAAREAAVAKSRGGVITGRVQVNGPVAWMRVLAGMLTDLDLLGYKEFHRTGQHVYYHVQLFRESTGEALGTVDGRRITSLRTAATAACAVAHWATGRPVRLGMIGSGEEAREGLRAVAGASTVTGATVYSPTPANREAYATEMAAELDLEVVALGSQQEVLDSCDVVYVATSSHHTPILSAEHLGKVGMVAAIGATQPVHRELEPDVFRSADLVVLDTPDAVEESGDGQAATAAGWDSSAVMLLGDYLAGDPAPGSDGYTLFKSVGSVEQDLVLALNLLREAEARGVGTPATDPASLRVMR